MFQVFMKKAKAFKISALPLFFFIAGWLSLVLGACDFLQQQGSQSRNALVDILTSSAEGGEQAVGRNPLVFLKERKDPQICRRGLPDPKTYKFKENCFNLGRDEEESASGSGANTGQTTGSAGSQTNADNANSPTNNNQEEEDSTVNHTLSVGGNWFKMGLIIINKSKKEWLIIDNISFNISGRWGSETLQGEKDIASGYCGTDPLYIIPPWPDNQSIPQAGGTTPIHFPFFPARAKRINNLILFIDGVPIPDGPPTQSGTDNTISSQPSPATGSQGSTDGGGAGTNPSSNPAQPEEEPPVFVLDRLPNYRVQALARGYWINAKCETVHNFEKSFQFSLSSSFQN